MKYVKFIVIILLLISAVFINKQVRALMPLSGKLIIIDVGHGGKDSGSFVDNIKESDVNLEIAKCLEIELVKAGASVVLTRDGDFDLASPNVTYRKKSDFDNRIKLINNSKADMYLSIHLNYLADTAYFGPQVFYNNEENQEIAQVIQNTFNEALETKREIKKIPNRTYMYDKLTVPGVLIECGFLSNVQERAKLVTLEYQQKLAVIIKNALINYY